MTAGVDHSSWLASRLGSLEDLVRAIAAAEEAGQHDRAALLWELLDEQVDQLPAERARQALTMLLVAAASGASTTLAVGPAGAFSGTVKASACSRCFGPMGECVCWSYRRVDAI